MNTRQLALFVLGTGLLGTVATACEGDSDDGGEAAGASGKAGGGGSSGKGGMTGAGTGSGATGGKAGSGSGGDAGDESGGEAGSASGGKGGGGSSGTGGGTSGSAGSASAGSAGKGGGGSAGGSGSAELDALCTAFAKLKKDKARELGCSSDDSEAVARMCKVSGSCFDELEAQYKCEKAASTWSCDTGDGHPQTNGACNETSATFFGCLGPAVHEEDPFGCAAIAATNHEMSMALGCNVDDAIENTCNQLYLRSLCIEPWEALTSCTASATEGDFECDEDDNLVPTICSSERSAFDACLENPS